MRSLLSLLFRAGRITITRARFVWIRCQQKCSDGSFKSQKGQNVMLGWHFFVLPRHHITRSSKLFNTIKRGFRVYLLFRQQSHVRCHKVISSGSENRYLYHFILISSHQNKSSSSRVGTVTVCLRDNTDIKVREIKYEIKRDYL